MSSIRRLHRVSRVSLGLLGVALAAGLFWHYSLSKRSVVAPLPSGAAVPDAVVIAAAKERSDPVAGHLERLLRSGANANAPGGMQFPSATWQQPARLLKDSTTAKTRSDTALIVATRDGNEAALKTLLAHGAAVDTAGQFDRTALHWACFMGNAEKVRLLLAAGARVDRRCTVGFTPLHYALQGMHTSMDPQPYRQILEALLRQGADVNARRDRIPQHLLASGARGLPARVQTPLDMARHFHLSEAEVLMQKHSRKR